MAKEKKVEQITSMDIDFGQFPQKVEFRKFFQNLLHIA